MWQSRVEIEHCSVALGLTWPPELIHLNGLGLGLGLGL